MTDVRVRFAPSPTGSLHVGSARTALYNFLYARHVGGAMVLRIEDTDLKRSKSAHDTSIINDLAWLGLRADEGPDVGGPHGPYRQSERAHLYEAAVQQLLATGWAYPCFCPQELLEERKEQQLAAARMPKYDRTCCGLSPTEVDGRFAAGEEAAIRFRVPDGDVTFADIIHGPITFSSDVIGDFIIKRTDGGYSYNFAVVVDDAGMEITDVIRGEDHITNTARQMMLFAALGKPAPRYGHHSLILAPDGSKLSKRHGATSIGDFRSLGYLSAAMVNYLALLSWHPSDEREKFDLEELVQEFELGRVSKSPAIFDIHKLNWLNGLYLRELEPATLYAAIEPYLRARGINLALVQREVVAEAVQANLVVLGDAPQYAAVFVDEVDPATCAHAESLLEPGADMLYQLAREIFGNMANEFLPVPEARDTLKRLVELAKEQGLKGKAVYHPLRVALSGREEGPELFYLVAGLGKSRILARLKAAAEFVDRRTGPEPKALV
ncbi:MAG: glutamate--tRNA ligase [Actinobacteria bacterium RBG_16_64_13]|nr:MAG: glutamate--tRNA ligase [Actinobacteria bacterium RBG_16_64_13]